MCDESNISPIPLTVWTWKITSLLKCSPCIIRFTYNSVGCSVFRVVQPSLLLNSRTFHQIVIANIESVQFSCSLVSWLFATQWTAAHQASLSITDSWSLLKLMSSSRWCHPTISFSVFPFSSRLQSFPASGSCQMNHLFASDGQSIGVSASTSVLPMNIQDWFPLG